jgi:catechol 2,3-dioxygenase-like lactoylglutathione lyase family enzyme
LTFKVTSLDHIVLNVSDVDRSLAFYVDGLGLEPVRLGEYRRGDVKFPSVRVDAGTIIDLFSPEMRSGAAPPNAANLNHFCLVVEGGIGEILARVRAINATVDEGPIEVFGARGNGRSIYISDPDNNKIELRSYALE